MKGNTLQLGESNSPSLSPQRILQAPESRILHPSFEMSVVDNLMKIVSSILRLMIKEWAEKNKHISNNVLISHLAAATVDFGNSFTNKAIVVLTWDIVFKKGGKDFKGGADRNSLGCKTFQIHSCGSSFARPITEPAARKLERSRVFEK